jgi:hypothetical protein
MCAWRVHPLHRPGKVAAVSADPLRHYPGRKSANGLAVPGSMNRTGARRRAVLSREGAHERNLSPPREALPQGLAFEQLGDEERCAFVVAEIEEGEDVRVTQSGDGLRLALEPPQTLGVRGEGFRQHLDGNVSPEPLVAGAVHLTHPARAQLPSDAEATADRTRQVHFGSPQLVPA